MAKHQVSWHIDTEVIEAIKERVKTWNGVIGIKTTQASIANSLLAFAIRETDKQTQELLELANKLDSERG